MKIKLLLSILSVLLFFGGCNNTSNAPVLSTAISQIDMKANNHIEQLSDYDSPYTVCYKNKDDTYSLYIFASPIQYKTDAGKYIVINNTVVKSSKEGFLFENKANSIKTYFPKTLSDSFLVEKETLYMEFKPDFNIEGFSEVKQTVFTNMYGDKISAVIYERKDMDLVFYATKAGIKTEIVLKEKPDSNEFSFIVKSGAMVYENKQNGDVLFKNGGEIESIIYQPFVQYASNKGPQLDVNTQMNISKEEDDYCVKIIIDESTIENANYPLKFDPSFEIYLNKMPDSTVYSKQNTNNYLANFAVLGEHKVFGEGWHYVRPRLNFLFGLQPNKILSATYATYVYYSPVDNLSLSLYKLDEFWSSTRMVWNDKEIPIERQPFSSKSCKKYNFVSFDITQFAKMCFLDSSFQTESNGFLLKCENTESEVIISTSDSSLYTPFLALELSRLPSYFEPKENINPT